MSIATLKKKTQTKYNNMSVGSKTGFSINGTHRSQGYVGQTSLSRSLPRTLMRGAFARGHGGCCGTFNFTPIVQSAVTSLEDPTVVKSSSINNTGMISTKYKWIDRPYPYAFVKPDNNVHNNVQSEYIKRIRNQTIRESDACDIANPVTNEQNKCSNHDAYFKTEFCTHTKPMNKYVAISCGEHIITLQDKCSQQDTEIVYPANNGMPYIGFN